MSRLVNYIGQLRIYSLADLVLMLVAIGANTHQLAGAVVLHVAFLVYLESRHKHSYRSPVNVKVSYLLFVFGLIIYSNISGVLYVIFSYLYTKKTKSTGYISPLMRGLQMLAITGGILGYSSLITYVVGAVMLVRNLIGDVRDINKDRLENVRTLPVLIGMKGNYKYIHLLSVILTSIFFWSLSTISITWLFFVILIEISTYNLTPR